MKKMEHVGRIKTAKSMDSPAMKYWWCWDTAAKIRVTALRMAMVERESGDWTNPK